MKNDPNREKRLAEELRKNLLRRKEQKKQQQAPATDQAEPSSTDTP